jgi:hypothetical protein
MSRTERTLEDAIFARRGHLVATARKSGKNPRWPYVPVIAKVGHHIGPSRTEIVRNRAFETRDEAITYAQRVVDHRNREFAVKLLDPCWRDLREAVFGLPPNLRWDNYEEGSA